MMFPLLLIVLALACSTAHARQRIVNGTAAEKDEFLHQVSLARRSCYYIFGGMHCSPWYHSCGAVVVGERWVATAAHCVDTATDMNTIQLVVGEHNRHLSDGETNFTVNSIFVHENWNDGSAGSFPNDIALMKTNNAIGSSHVIDMATQAEEADFIGEDCAISGWGRTGGSAPVSDILQKTTGRVMLKDQCAQEGNWTAGNFNDGHICVVNHHTGACNGDSGGPLTCGTGDSKRLLGVTSWGRSGCLTDYASVYTRIAYFYGWIQDTIKANS